MGKSQGLGHLASDIAVYFLASIGVKLPWLVMWAQCTQTACPESLHGGELYHMIIDQTHLLPCCTN